MSPVVVRTFKDRAATIQFALSRITPWARPVHALAAHANIAEVGENLVAVGQIDAGAHGDCDIGSQVDDDVPRGGFQQGIVVFTGGTNLADNSSRSGSAARTARLSVRFVLRRSGRAQRPSRKPSRMLPPPVSNRRVRRSRQVRCCRPRSNLESSIDLRFPRLRARP